jgi:hypothetical protein
MWKEALVGDSAYIATRADEPTPHFVQAGIAIHQIENVVTLHYTCRPSRAGKTTASNSDSSHFCC